MKVTLDNGKVLEVEKLPLGKYADLLKGIQELPKHLDQFKDFRTLSNEQFVSLIPGLIGDCLPDIIRIIEIATELTNEEIQALGITEVIDIVGAIFTVNNYAAIYEKIKKMIPQRNQADPVLPNSNPTT